MRVTTVTAVLLLLFTAVAQAQIAALREYDIPIAGRGVNAAGETFTTTMRLYNPADSPVDASVQFFAAGTSQAPQGFATVRLPAHGSATIADLGNTLHVQGTGGVKVVAPSALVITTHVYVDRRGTHEGTLGQFVPAVPASELLTDGAITNINESVPNPNLNIAPDGFRTNIGFFNPSLDSAVLTLDLRDENGVSLGTRNLTLGPNGQTQQRLVDLFGSAVRPQRDLTLRFHSSLPVAGYASIIDWRSSDAFLVPAERDSAGLEP